MEKDDFVIYSHGIVCISICTSLDSVEEIEKRANEILPTGIDSKWKISKDKTFRTGEPNPCPCEQRKGYKHYLLNC